MESGQFEAGCNFFPYGTQYYREPTPLADEWEVDLKEIARAGYTHVQYRPQWICHERERGSFTWDDTDMLFDLAAKYCLNVVLKPLVECAPDWVFTELGGYRIGFGGQRIGPHAHGAFYPGGWMPCFDNPHVRTSAEDFVKEIAVRYKDHPALWFYNAWSEPRSRPLGQCQCEHSIISYREWLKQKFGSIEALNAEHGKYWTSFDTVYPPTDAWDYTQMYLWRLWAADAVAGHVKLVTDAIKSVDPAAFVMTHVGMCSALQDPCCDASDDIANAEVVDRYGTSFPVNLHAKTLKDHAAADYISSWLARVDPNYWCHEFYTNGGLWSVPPRPEVLNRLIWMAISGGTSGFTFWQYRSERVGNETNGYGMRNIDGSATERSEVCDNIARVLREHGSKMVGTYREASGIKLLYNRRADVMARVQTLRQNDLVVSGNNQEFSGHSWYKEALRNAHAMYLQIGETVDWVVPGDDLSDADVLHVTCDEMISESDANWLRDYVKMGGRVIVECPFACRDENTWVSPKRPNHGLEDLLGCVESQRVQANFDGADYVRFASDITLQAAIWRIELVPTTGTVVARWNNDSASAVVNQYGKGKVLTLGHNLSLTYKGEIGDASLKALLYLLSSELDVETCIDEVNEGVWIRKRIDDDKTICFVFNLNEYEERITLPNQPKAVWQDAGCYVRGETLVMKPDATWVAEL